jgi:hypothetical protein
MNRREFTALLGGATAAPLVARAQSRAVPRIGVLMNTFADDANGRGRLAAFIQGLKQLGWAEGATMQLDTPQRAQRSLAIASVRAKGLGGGLPSSPRSGANECRHWH